MGDRLNDKVCLITGAGSGIGQASARRFAEEGARVVVADIDLDAARRTVDEISTFSPDSVAEEVDVTDETQTVAVADRVARRFGRIDVLFNNAGIAGVGDLLETEPELFDRVMRVNVRGVYLMSRAVVPQMIKQRSGSIINMSSCIAEIGLARRVSYAASKGAVFAMTKSMQVDVAPYGIRVNALLPGTILTPFVERYLKESYAGPEEGMASIRKRQLSNDLGRPEDVAQAALVDLGEDTFRPYLNTVVVGLTSTAITVLLGSMAAYGLVRMRYQVRLGAIAGFAAGVALAVVLMIFRTPWLLAAVAGLAFFLLLLQTVARRGKRAVGNDDIAFWMISQRMLPPVAVVIPIYVFFQQLSLLDTWGALIITYVAVHLPIVVWLMRDYLQSIPLELEESAAIDGASPYRVFRSIVLPLAVPGLVATFLFVLVFAWNEYLIALFLTSSNAQTLPLTVAAQNATRGPQWWYMSVLILIMITPVIAMAIALERFIARGLLVGAVKG